MESNSRDGFSSKIGVIAAAAGSAIGLGNIWRFPYIIGDNGGGAFLIVYLLCVLTLGIPIMIGEFALGRISRVNAIATFRNLAPKSIFSIVGYIGLLSAFCILSFYGVVAGWCFSYILKSLSGEFNNLTADKADLIFNNLITGGLEPIFWQVAFMFLTGFIVLFGIKNGIEKYSKILMPLLFIIIIILDIRAITLANASDGLSFLFKFDFSKITLNTIFMALGQAFFSLSVGMGTMITYGSYISKKENLLTTSLNVAFADTLVAILAGIAIFPAVFTFGIDPSSGAGLAFISLPMVFSKMFMGNIFSLLFFILLLVAGLTSSISILEVIVAFICEDFSISRKKVTILTTIIVSLSGVICSLSNGFMKIDIFNHSYMDFLNYLSSNFLLPLGAILISIFIGFCFDKKLFIKELTNNGEIELPFKNLLFFLFKFFIPFIISIIFLQNLNIIKL